MHREDLVTGENEPGKQATHSVAPSREYVPALHDRQVDAPSVFVYVPPTQSPHNAILAESAAAPITVEYFPRSHLEQ